MERLRRAKERHDAVFTIQHWADTVMGLLS
jgi:hypothetical protein